MVLSSRSRGRGEKILQLAREWEHSSIIQVRTFACEPVSLIIRLLMHLHEKKGKPTLILIQRPKIHEL